MQFPVQLTWIPVTCRLRKPRPHNETLDWPIIQISDWARVLLDKNPQYLLGGLHLNQAEGWRRMFANFWDSYRTIDPNHMAFEAALDLSCTIPYALHGDEGKGLRQKPFLVESFQPIIGFHGPSHTNESGLFNCT